MEISGQLHAPAALLLGKNTGTRWTGDWIGPIGDLDVLGKKKSLTLAGIRTLDRPARSLVARNFKYLRWDCGFLIKRPAGLKKKNVQDYWSERL
jgi:hypothetical protein